MKERTRLKMATRACIFLGVMSGVAMYLDKDTIATTCIAGIITIVTLYIGGESYRGSSVSVETEEPTEKTSLEIFANEDFQDDVPGLNIDE